MSGTLEQIEIRTPCPMDWDLMDGNDRVRFCDRCKKNVYNIVSMTEAEAVALIDNAGEEICGRIFRRDDGTVVTSDCPPRQNSPLANRKRPLQFSMAALMMLVTFSAGLAASAPWIGAKVQPLIDRYFSPTHGKGVPIGGAMAMGDMVAPMPPTQNLPQVIQGEVSGIKAPL